MLKRTTQYKLPRLLSAAALAAGAALLPATAAANVLFLSTEESPGNYEDHVSGAYNAFAAQLGAELIDGRGALTSNQIGGQPLGAAHLAGVDTVVVATVGGTLAAEPLAFIRDIMLNDPDRSLILLIDSCCNRDNILAPLVTTLQQSLPGIAIDSTDNNAWYFNPRNDSSPYATASFSALAQVSGAWYRQVLSVPTGYAIYLDEGRSASGAPVTPATATVDNAYALLVPQKVSNNGAGACTFLMTDTTPFFNHVNVPAGQPAALAQSMLHATRQDDGACKMDAASPELSVALNGPASVTVGTPAAFTLTVTNNGITPATRGSVTVTLPAGLTLDGAPPAGCTLAGQELTCTPANAATPLAGNGASTAFNFNLVSSAAAPALTIAVEINDVTDDDDTNDNTATLTIASIAAGTTPPGTGAGGNNVQPVPVMGWPALLGLSAMLPWLAMRRRQRRAG